MAISSSTTAYIGLGSNLGDSIRQLYAAWQVLGQKEGVCCVEISSPYTTSPVGMESEHSFVNAVGCLSVDIEPLQLLDHLLSVESEFGRMRNQTVSGYQDRTLDLDLLYYGETQLVSDRLILPHPLISDRLFVLAPMAEISPLWRDPLGHCTIRYMEENLRLRIERGIIEPQVVYKSRWT